MYDFEALLIEKFREEVEPSHFRNNTQSSVPLRDYFPIAA